jgi:hypothetical protein
MKNLILFVSALFFMAASACAGAAVKGGASARARVQFKAYSMDNNYFACSIPEAWSLEREKEKDERYKIYEIQLLAPESEKAPTSVFVSYYAKDNEDFNSHQDYIDRNSKNIAGETKSPRERYEPVKKTTLGGRSGFMLTRERMVYLHPESKSDDSVQLKEKMYILPAKEGFYVLHFSAAKTAFLENLPVFEKIAKSFKGKP